MEFVQCWWLDRLPQCPCIALNFATSATKWIDKCFYLIRLHEAPCAVYEASQAQEFIKRLNICEVQAKSKPPIYSPFFHLIHNSIVYFCTLCFQVFQVAAFPTCLNCFLIQSDPLPSVTMSICLSVSSFILIGVSVDGTVNHKYFGSRWEKYYGETQSALGPFHSKKHCLFQQGKPVFARVWTGPECSRRLRLPGVIDTRHVRVIYLSSPACIETCRKVTSLYEHSMNVQAVHSIGPACKKQFTNGYIQIITCLFTYLLIYY